MRKFKVLDLFSGIGGISLGLERTGGFETVAFCEIDPFCRKVLAKHWPDVPCFEDVTKLRGEDVGDVDAICGGYPCQPFSHAGKRRGKEDDRHLWPEMRRLVEELGPSFVLGENVAGHITMGLDDVLSDLESLGYACRAFVIPACAVDARHRRDRLWILAVANSDGLQKQGLCAHAGDQKAHGDWETNYSFHASRWPAESNVGRVAYGVPRRVDRLRSLGNAVVPQIPELIGRAILEAMAV